MRFRVGLLIESPDTAGSQLLDGIVQYARLHPHWTAEYSAWWKPKRRADYQAFDGLIIRRSDRLSVALSTLPTPLVDVSCSFSLDAAIPRVMQDEEAIGRSVAAHFLERGYRHLAFVGRKTPLFSRRRLAGFRRAADAAGADCRVFEQPGFTGWSRESVLAPIRRWLGALPRPVGVMGDADDTARLVLEGCRGLLHVPEEAAVVGVDNDVHLCELCTPPLSSVRSGMQGVGFRAAEVLDAMMSGGARPAAPILMPPGDLCLRRSSDAYALQDQVVARAVRQIHDRPADGLTIGRLCRDLATTPRTLQLRFRAAIGRTPRDELRFARLQLAQKLLAEPVSVAVVAAKAGFSSQSRFGQSFKAYTGLTPLAYRQRLREGQTG